MKYFLSIAVVFLTACGTIKTAPERGTGEGIKNDGSTGAVRRSLPFDPKASSQKRYKTRVVVLPVLAQIPINEAALKDARVSLLQFLSKSRDLILVSPDDLGIKLDDYINQGEYNLPEISKKAYASGINAILDASIIDIKSKKTGDEVGLMRKLRVDITSTIRIRLTNTKTGIPLLTETVSSQVQDVSTRFAQVPESDAKLRDDPEVIQAAVRKTLAVVSNKVNAALSKTTWEGRVAAIKGDRVYVNAGQLSGIQLGDILKVMDEGEDIFDPDTGRHLGRVPGRLKGTLEVVSFFGEDGSISIIHSGSGFKDNDRVELY